MECRYRSVPFGNLLGEVCNNGREVGSGESYSFEELKKRNLGLVFGNWAYPIPNTQSPIPSKLVGPPHKSGTPGKPTAKSGEYDIITFLQPAFPFPKAKWNSTCSGVTIFLNIDHHFIP